MNDVPYEVFQFALSYSLRICITVRNLELGREGGVGSTWCGRDDPFAAIHLSLLFPDRSNVFVKSSQLLL
jgi:hypothetical protein